jgi:heme-degrading monooxygenase HmoA
MADAIVRMWKGYGTAEGVRRYCDEHFPHSVLPELRKVAGFVRATLLVRAGASETELVVATEWESLEAVKGFAGEAYESAVVDPAVRELLERFDNRVTHYTIALAIGGSGV